jgi:hypothetical protein
MPHARVSVTACLQVFHAAPTHPDTDAPFAGKAGMGAYCAAKKRPLAPGIGCALRVFCTPLPVRYSSCGSQLSCLSSRYSGLIGALILLALNM